MFLIISKEDEPTRAVTCEAEMVLGRSSTCDVALSDEHRDISRRHAQVRKGSDDTWRLEDLGSHNGTLLNGKAIDQAALNPGDVIQIGQYRLVFSSTPDAPDVPADSNDNYSTTISCVRPDPQALDAIQLGSVDGPEVLDRWHLQIIESLTKTLWPMRAQSVRERACEILCDRLGASACHVLRIQNIHDPAAPDVLASCRNHACGGEDDDIYLSRTLIDAVCREGLPVLAGTRGDSSGGILVSNPDFKSSLAAAVTVDHDADLELVYLVLADSRATGELTDFIGLLARLIGMATNSARHYEIEAERIATKRERDLAREIQEKLIPAAVQEFGDVHAGIEYQPCAAVGGDYCDIWQREDGTVTYVIADVCGKGFPAAIVMSLMHSAIHIITNHRASCAEVITELNDILCRNTPDGRFVTLVALWMDTQTGSYELVNAGHPSPLLADTSGNIQEIKPATQMPLGIAPTRYESTSGRLNPGELMLLLTDGVTETFNESGQMLGTNGVNDWLSSVPIDADVLAHPVKLIADLSAHCAGFRNGNPVTDDQTIMAISRTSD